MLCRPKNLRHRAEQLPDVQITWDTTDLHAVRVAENCPPPQRLTGMQSLIISRNGLSPQKGP